MTIGIGRKFGRRVVILSDTMISDSRLDRRKAFKSDSIPGRLKAIILTPYVSVAYSGHADPALHAIRRAQKELKTSGEVSKAKEILAKSCADRGADLQFILAYHKNGEPYLHKITRLGVSDDLENCFIGDAHIVHAASAGQSRYKDTPNWEHMTEESQFSIAFIDLFRGLTVNENVGGFPINLLGSPYGHLYQGGGFQTGWDTIQGGVGVSAAQHQAQRTGATAWQWITVNTRLRGLALLGMALPQAGLGFVYSPMTEYDPEWIRVPVISGPGFIDSQPLQAALIDRMDELAASIGGGVVELDAPWEPVMGEGGVDI